VLAGLGVLHQNDPFELLALTPADHADRRVIDALAQRMSQVAAHPLSETPEGNEARLALHAAAARLLDPAVRRALLLRAGVTPAKPQAPSVGRGGLSSRALLVIASEGGWNQRALRRLAMIAHAEGVPSGQLPAALRSLTRLGRRDASPAERARVGQSPGGAPAALQRRSLGPTIAVWLIAVLALLALGLTWMSLSHRSTSAAVNRAGRAPDGTPAGIEPERIDAVTEADPSSGPAESAAVPEPIAVEAEPDWAAALIGMSRAAEAPEPDVVALTMEHLAGQWVDMEPARRTVLLAAFVDLVHRIDDQGAVRVVDRLGGLIGSDDPAAAAWGGGVLARLSREQSLPTAVDNAIIAATAATIGASGPGQAPSFEAGVLAALEHIGGRWASGRIPEAAGLAAWLAVSDRLRAASPEMAGRATRTVLSAVLREGPDPFDNGGAHEVIARLTERLALPEDRESAAMVLAALADQGFGTRGLSVMVSAMGRQPWAKSLGASLVLSPSATAAERSRFRSELEAALLGTQVTSWASEEFIAVARATLSRPVPAATVPTLAETVVASRLCWAAADLLWSRRLAAEATIAGLRTDADQLVAAPIRPAEGLGGDASRDWALRYLTAARNIPVRQSLLSELVRSKPKLGPIAAELLVSEALMGTPAQVRRDALQAVPLFAGEPSVVNALLELLPRAPAVASTRDLVVEISGVPLPAIDDPRWAVSARRAVVGRLTELLAAEGDGRRIDALAMMLAESYAARSSPGRDPTPATAADLDVLAAGVQRAWAAELGRADRTGSAGATQDRLRRALDSRLALSEGAVSAFAAYQVSALETAAEAVRAERPERAADVAAVMAEVASARRGSRDIFEQILHVERSFVRLWLIRMGATP
jgi:hypothetical protein